MIGTTGVPAVGIVMTSALDSNRLTLIAITTEKNTDKKERLKSVTFKRLGIL